MNFGKAKELFSSASSAALDKAIATQSNITKKAIQQLPSKSDAEIAKMYQVRYSNPKWNDTIINAIEREAMRRGID